MKAEERLRLQTKETEYELAKQAIALLREFVSIRRGSARSGDYPVAQYGARMACWRKKVYKFLEGGDGGP